MKTAPAVSDERNFKIEGIDDLCRELKSNRAPRGMAMMRNSIWREARALQAELSHRLILSFGNPESTYNGDYPETIAVALYETECEIYALIEQAIRLVLPSFYQNTMKEPVEPPVKTAVENDSNDTLPLQGKKPRKSNVPQITHNKGEPVVELLKLDRKTLADLKSFCAGKISMNELTENMQDDHNIDIVRVRVATRLDKTYGVNIVPNGNIAFDIERTVHHHRDNNGNKIATHLVTVIV